MCSVVVVLPASMWAMMPRLRTLGKSKPAMFAGLSLVLAHFRYFMKTRRWIGTMPGALSASAGIAASLQDVQSPARVRVEPPQTGKRLARTPLSRRWRLGLLVFRLILLL